MTFTPKLFLITVF